MTQMTTLDLAAVEPETRANGEGASDQVSVARLVAEWQRYFGVVPTVFDGKTGEPLGGGGDPPLCDTLATEVMSRQVACGRDVELIEFDEPLAVVAVPVHLPDGGTMVTVARFACARVDGEAAVSRCAQMMGVDFAKAADWASRQTVWTVDSFVRAAELWQAKWTAERNEEVRQDQLEAVSEQITSTYEEIALLYRLLRSLDLSRDVRTLTGDVVTWLSEVVPAQGLALAITSREGTAGDLAEPDSDTFLLVQGEWPIDEEAVGPTVEGAGSTAGDVIVANAWTDGGVLPEGIRSFVRVPIVHGDQHYGWMAAANHVANDKEFGSVECELMTSVATILSTHLANVGLYRAQGELFAGMVRALSSSIDAKDPYTCGHSDRVARVAVRLGREMGCDAEMLKTVYLSGLLHDIGKIGIDDQVLRKPGRLTTDEYDHIKTHPETGYRILLGIPHLKAVLPGVRHHHESYDGTGYPQQLAGQAIPFLGRLIAVADAFDAMSSDRPYRKGLGDAKIDEILRNGAGQQWDPDVVDAFFQARDEVREIAQTAPEIDLADTVSWP